MARPDDTREPFPKSAQVAGGVNDHCRAQLEGQGCCLTLVLVFGAWSGASRAGGVGTRVLLVSPRPIRPGDHGSWLRAGPGIARRSFALPVTFTYIVIHGSYA